MNACWPSPAFEYLPIVELHFLDCYFLHYHILARPVLAVAREIGDLIDHILTFDHFAEDGVFPGEPRCGRDGDEELRSVGVRASVGHGQLAGLVKFVRRAFGFVFELIARAAHACSLRIAALDHEIWNDAVEDGAVVKPVTRFFARRGMRPLALAFRKFHKIGHRLWCLFFKQPAHDVSFRGLKGGIKSGLTGHECPFGRLGLVVGSIIAGCQQNLIRRAARLCRRCGFAWSRRPRRRSACLLDRDVRDLYRRKGLSFMGSRDMLAICLTSATDASSHWPKMV